MIIDLVKTSISADTFRKGERVIVRVAKDQWYTGTVEEGGADSILVQFDEITQKALDIEKAAIDEFKQLDAEQQADYLLFLKKSGEDGPEFFVGPGSKYVPDEPGANEAEIEGNDLKWVKKIKTKRQFHHRLSNDAAKKVIEIPSYVDYYDALEIKQKAVKKLRSSPILNKEAPGAYYALWDLLKGISNVVQPGNLPNADRTRAWLLKKTADFDLVFNQISAVAKNLGYTAIPRTKDENSDEVAEDFINGKAIIRVVRTKGREKYFKVTLMVDPQQFIDQPMKQVPQRAQKIEVDSVPTVDGLRPNKSKLQAITDVHGYILANDIVTVVAINSDKTKIQVQNRDLKKTVILATELNLFREV